MTPQELIAYHKAESKIQELLKKGELTESDALLLQKKMFDALFNGEELPIPNPNEPTLNTMINLL